MPDKFPIAGACDCHVHVIGPKSRFPLAAPRAYTPMDAPLAALEAMMVRLGLERAIIVQPSIYGTDNSCMLDALQRLDGKTRGVGVIDPSTSSAAQLDEMHRHGVRGLRVNIVSRGPAPVEAIRAELAATAALCARNGWYVQAFVPASLLEMLAPVLTALPVPVVLDHFAMVAPENANGPDADRVCRLLAAGHVWVKLSGSYRITADPFDPAVNRLAARYTAANPERLLWASDWPHTPAHPGKTGAEESELPYRDVDTKGLLNLLGRWVGDANLARVLAENPATLHDFG